MNGWSYVEGNPIRYVDPSGQCRGLIGKALEACNEAKKWMRLKKSAIVIRVELIRNSCQMLVHNVRSDPKTAAKEGIEVAVTTSAEFTHQYGYKNAASFVEEYPVLYEYGNDGIGMGQMGAEAVTDMNPDTMGWEDLTVIWLFELGDYDGEYAFRDGKGLVFGPEAITTQELMEHEGGLKARKRAINAIKGGAYSQGITNYWDFNPDAAFDTVLTFNGLQFFMGSYSVNVDITNNGDGSYRLDYKFVNVSGLKSATRYRAREYRGGPRRAIIPDDERGSGLKVGGNIAEEWHSSETIVVEEQFIIHSQF